MTITIGTHWTPRRGRKHLTDVEVKMIYRRDKSVLIADANGGRRTITISTLKHDWKPSDGN